MVEHRTLRLNGREHIITISDEREALLAARAAGRAAVGVVGGKAADEGFLPCAYAVERAGDADEEFLYGVLKRTLGLPWVIAETERLVVREFSRDDPLCGEMVEGGLVFMDREKRDAYIANQYGFFGYGIWALEEKVSGRIVGKAGLREDSLGYHIYAPYRKRGYASEACRAIMAYARERLGFEALIIETDASNEASIKTALALGFHPVTDIPGEIRASDGHIRFVRNL